MRVERGRFQIEGLISKGFGTNSKGRLGEYSPDLTASKEPFGTIKPLQRCANLSLIIAL